MSIRTIMDQIVTIQEGLSISDPLAMSVKKAYKFVPAQNQTLTDLPCWVNHCQLSNTVWDPGDMRQVEYSVNMMLAVGEATVEQDRLADAAWEFFEEMLKSFRTNFKLGGSDRISNLRGEGPTTPRLTWGGKAYIGLDLWLDILVMESNA